MPGPRLALSTLEAGTPFPPRGNPQKPTAVLTCIRNCSNKTRMIKHVLFGVAAVALMSGVASAQVYPPSPPPSAPVAPPSPVPAAPPPAVSPPPSTTTRIVKKGVDANGNEVTKKETYREGVEGNTESRTKTETSPLGTTTTRSTTTTTPQQRQPISKSAGSGPGARGQNTSERDLRPRQPRHLCARLTDARIADHDWRRVHRLIRGCQDRDTHPRDCDPLSGQGREGSLR
jgi:hypothetical protein